VALGLSSIFFLMLFSHDASLASVAQTLFSAFEGHYTLLAIPFFILASVFMSTGGVAARIIRFAIAMVGSFRGGLAIASVFACMLFAALSGSSPATVVAIGSIVIAGMISVGYTREFAAGVICNAGTLGILIPPSVTMIVYGIATETSIGRLFLAGVVPGLLLVGLFMVWSIFSTWRQGRATTALGATRYSWAQKVEVLPRVVPFLLIIIGVLYALYGGVATPSEAAGVAAMFVLVLVAVIYKVWQPQKIWSIINSSMKESVMIMMIIAASALFAYTLSSLYVTQSVAESIANMDVNRWVLMGLINLFLLVAGFFLPPVAVIVMTAPILLPIIEIAGFDPYWFAVIFTINMEIGLITPPVGLNLYVINGIAPDVPLPTVLKGAIPYVLCMIVAIIILCIFPEIATWLPTALMGTAIT